MPQGSSWMRLKKPDWTDMPTIDRNDEHATRYEATLEEQIDYVARQYTGHQAKDRFIEAILASLERLRAIERAEGMPEEPTLYYVFIEKRFSGEGENVAAVLKEDYDALRLHAQHLQDRLNRMEALMREAYEIYAGMEGIPKPQTACEDYLLRIIDQMQKAMSAALLAKIGKE